MIKKLFFTAALLVPGIAYGADPSANLPIQIVPAGPAVPAPAAAAGFTTRVLHSDFTSPAYADTSTWLQCAGASSPIWWTTNNANYKKGTCPIITTDGGVQVFQFRIDPPDKFFEIAT